MRSVYLVGLAVLVGCSTIATSSYRNKVEEPAVAEAKAGPQANAGPKGFALLCDGYHSSQSDCLAAATRACGEAYQKVVHQDKYVEIICRL